MIRVAHFATKKSLYPLIRAYGMTRDPATWMKAPPWLRKMWDTAVREAGKGYPQRWEWRTEVRLTKKRGRWSLQTHAEVRAAIEGVFCTRSHRPLSTGCTSDS